MRLEITMAVREFGLFAIATLRERVLTMAPTSFGPMVDTEAAANSFRYRWEGDTLTLYSTIDGEFNYIFTLEHGIRPSSDPEAQPSPDHVDSIEAWIKRKGITSSDSKISQSSLAYLIARKQRREGSLLYREGGNSGILSGFLQDQAMYEEHLFKPLQKILGQKIKQLIYEY